MDRSLNFRPVTKQIKFGDLTISLDTDFGELFVNECHESVSHPMRHPLIFTESYWLVNHTEVFCPTFK